jgi:hypothetical protein
MGRHVWSRLVVLVLVSLPLALTGSAARASAWADQLFGERSHDFGPVARGVKVRHTFVLTNRLSEPVTILDVRASCGCTTGRPSTSVVAPNGTATLDAEMDTRNFVGKKSTVLRVGLVTAGGKRAEVRLGITSTILSDIVLNPGTVDFGVVARGRAATQALTIERIGEPKWRALRMVSACRAIDATLTETARDSRLVAYELKVSLKPETPPGPVRDEIRVVTNDAESPVIPVQVMATVRGELSAAPALLGLERLPADGSARGRVLVRGPKPFTVRSVDGEGDGFTASADDATARPVHVVTIAYRPVPGAPRGDLRRAFRVHTDLAGEPPVDVTATLHVDP